MFFINTAFAQAAVRTTQEQTSSGLSEFITGFFTAIPFWIAAGVVIFASFFLANVIKKIVIFRLSKRDLHREVLILIERMVYTGIVILGLLIAFQIVGIDLAIILGFIGLGVGFALKDLLANFFAGIMILTQKKFKIGDVVEVSGQLGKIVDIDSRVTQVKGLDGTDPIIPNATMITAVVQNFTSNPFRRIALEVGVHYDTPLKKAVDLTLASIKKNQGVMPDPAPAVLATASSA